MGPGRMMEDGPGMLLPLVLKGIDLTDAQEKRVQRDHGGSPGNISNPVQRIAGRLTRTWPINYSRLETFGLEDLTIPMQRMAQLREQLTQEGLKVAIEVRDVLTPEQLTKAAEIKDRMRALHTEMRGLFRDKR